MIDTAPPSLAPSPRLWDHPIRNAPRLLARRWWVWWGLMLPYAAVAVLTLPPEALHRLTGIERFAQEILNLLGYATLTLGMLAQYEVLDAR